MPDSNKCSVTRLPAWCFAILAVFTVSACAPVPPMDQSPETPERPAGPETAAPPKAPAHCGTEQGTASWYGEAHQGRPTASGEPYDMHGMTAAHRTLSFGTRIQVTNDNNGRSVELTVTDRGPFIEGRILDVTYRAAQELDFVADGLARIQLEVLGPC